MYLKIEGTHMKGFPTEISLINVEDIIAVRYFDEEAVIVTRATRCEVHSVTHETARKVEEQMTVLDLTGD